MGNVRVIDVNVGVFDQNDRIAEEVRRMNKENQTFMMNVMASPGAGKTSTLLELNRHIGDKYKIGVMEADIDSAVDAESMDKAGISTIQVHTNGECAMDAAMTKAAIESFDTKDIDVLVLENVGNLVCPAEQDTGATINIEILSIPEGDDKPLKYPLMFEVCHCVLINKIDTRDYFKFDDQAVVERIKNLNPNAEIFFISAKTGEGFDKWTAWLEKQIALNK